MKKLIIIALTCTFFVGCAKKDVNAKFKNESIKSNIYCIEGVKYFLKNSAITVLYNPDGSLKTCE